MTYMPEPRSARILVVDDDPMILELITIRLQLAGHEVLKARNGKEALERLREYTPAALVLDINMPVVDGFEVLRQMRQTGQTDRVATMVLTARNQSADVKKAIELGARDFLAKPFQDRQLLARVARLLRTRSYPQPPAPQAAAQKAPGRAAVKAVKLLP
jgi:two-component system OmpR family response regulator